MEITTKQFEIIGHSLGIPVDRRRPEELPAIFNRNHFQAGKDHRERSHCEEMVEMGLMIHRVVFGQDTFNVTDEGKAVFEIQFNRTRKKLCCPGKYYNFKKGDEKCPKRSNCKLYDPEYHHHVDRKTFVTFRYITEFRKCEKYLDQLRHGSN